MNQMEAMTLPVSKRFRKLTATKSDLAGKRYVNLLRCSNLTQADTSPEGQKLINDGFASEKAMTWVADFYAEGVSGSQTFNRRDLEELLDAHRNNPFDVVLVHDWSRLTRGGIRHGNVVEDTFRKAGLRILSSTDPIPDGPEGELIKSVKHYANQLQARSISLAVARGLSQSLAKNSRPAAGRNPYALDREYLWKGQPRMLVRWDGRTQLWLKPGTEEEVERRERPPKLSLEEKKQLKRRRPRSFKGYRKQDEETSRLVRGSKARHETLVWMFTAHDVRRWGYHRIAQHLNEVMKVESPDGDKWTLKTVKSVLFNPIYLGVEVRHRWTGSLYNMVSEGGTVAVEVDQDQLEKEKRTSVPHSERPMDEWRLVDIEHLKDILPSPLREIAAERIMRQFDPTIPPHPRKGKALHTGEGRHKQLNSPFLLTHLLHSKQTGHSMRGETANRKLLSRRKLYRYYFDGGAAIRGERGLHIRRVPAEPVEQAVLDVVQQALSDAEGVRERVRAAAAAISEDRPNVDQKREQLEKERESISGRIRHAYRLLGNLGVEVVEQEIERDRALLAEIAKQLASLEKVHDAKGIDVETLMAGVTQRLNQLAGSLPGFANAEMKQLLAAMLDDLKIDLATGELTFSVVLTDWMRPPPAAQDEETQVRLDSPQPSWWAVEANASGPRLLLSQWACQSVNKRCYECARRAA